MTIEFERLNIFATVDERKYIQHCREMPLISFDGINPMCESPIVAIHRYALEHGLPEIEGYYGMDMRNGEFLKAKK